MSIYQTNLWICENCGTHHSSTEEVGMYDDPVVTLPEGQERWDYIKLEGADALACPKCVALSKQAAA